MTCEWSHCELKIESEKKDFRSSQTTSHGHNFYHLCFIMFQNAFKRKMPLIECIFLIFHRICCVNRLRQMKLLSFEVNFGWCINKYVHIFFMLHTLYMFYACFLTLYPLYPIGSTYVFPFGPIRSLYSAMLYTVYPKIT